MKKLEEMEYIPLEKGKRRILNAVCGVIIWSMLIGLIVLILGGIK